MQLTKVFTAVALLGAAFTTAAPTDDADVKLVARTCFGGSNTAKVGSAPQSIFFPGNALTLFCIAVRGPRL